MVEPVPERAPLPAGGRITQRRRAPEEWKAIVKDRYPAYISWELHEKIGAMLHDNHADYRNKQTRGVPRGGAALLHGIAWCGECGHKLVVQYSNARRYRCNHLARQHDLPLCQSLPMDPIDAAVSEAFRKRLRQPKWKHGNAPERLRATPETPWRKQQRSSLKDCATRLLWRNANIIASILITVL